MSALLCEGGACAKEKEKLHTHKNIIAGIKALHNFIFNISDDCEDNCMMTKKFCEAKCPAELIIQKKTLFFLSLQCIT